MTAYKQLQAEGYIAGRLSSGPFVVSPSLAEPEIQVHRHSHSRIGRPRASVPTRAQASLKGCKPYLAQVGSEGLYDSMNQRSTCFLFSYGSRGFSRLPACAVLALWQR
jgi:hypothetical protein